MHTHTRFLVSISLLGTLFLVVLCHGILVCLLDLVDSGFVEMRKLATITPVAALLRDEIMTEESKLRRAAASLLLIPFSFSLPPRGSRTTPSGFDDLVELLFANLAVFESAILSLPATSFTVEPNAGSFASLSTASGASAPRGVLRLGLPPTFGARGSIGTLVGASSRLFALLPPPLFRFLTPFVFLVGVEILLAL